MMLETARIFMHFALLMYLSAYSVCMRSSVKDDEHEGPKLAAISHVVPAAATHLRLLMLHDSDFAKCSLANSS